MGYAKIFKALSDPIRRNILIILRADPMSAGDIANNFNLSNATVSYHLSQLKASELIREKKHKNFIFYELNLSVFEEVSLWFSKFIGGNEIEKKTINYL